MQVRDWLLVSADQLTQGEGRECVFSSRVRIARNLDHRPFPNRAKAVESRQVLEFAQSIGPHLIGDGDAGNNFIVLDGLTDLECEALVEAHLISRRLLLDRTGAGLLLAEDGLVSVMVNEEDHFRIQARRGGADFAGVFAAARAVEERLAERSNLAKLDGLGHLTACPTNVGTGLRASAMMRLPALMHSRSLDECLAHRVGPGLVVRGIYGEGTEPVACFIQVSNQVTAGLEGERIIADVERVVGLIAQDESAARTEAMDEYALETADMAFRSAATLLSARLVGSVEALDRLAQVRLGLDLGLLSGVSPQCVDRLMLLTRPATLQIVRGEPLSPTGRDAARAEMLRTELADLRPSERPQ